MWLKLALGPLLLAQGRQVRRQALRLPEAAGPRTGVAGGPCARWRLLVLGDSSGAGVGVAHQSDALAQPLAQALSQRLGAPVGWQLLATTGHTAADALAALRQAQCDGDLLPADLLVTALGVNDVVGQTPARRWLAALDAIHGLAVQHAGVCCTLHSGLPPMGRFLLLPQPLRSVLGRDALRLDLALQRHLAAADAQAGRRCRAHVPVPDVPAAPARAGVAATKPFDPTQGWVASDGFHPGPEGYRLWTGALADAAASRLSQAHV